MWPPSRHAPSAGLQPELQGYSRLTSAQSGGSRDGVRRASGVLVAPQQPRAPRHVGELPFGAARRGLRGVEPLPEELPERRVVLTEPLELGAWHGLAGGIARPQRVAPLLELVEHLRRLAGHAGAKDLRQPS